MTSRHTNTEAAQRPETPVCIRYDILHTMDTK